MTRTILYGTAAGAAVALAVLLYGSLSGPAPSLDGAVSTGSAPRIRPDCSGVTLPPNIAPLNFVVEEPGERYAVRIRSHGGEPISIHSDDPVQNIYPVYLTATCDLAPPQAIEDLSVGLAKADIHLWWTEPFDDTGICYYVIYRSNTTGSMGDSLASTTSTSYVDMGAAGDAQARYFYAVKAVDVVGRKSEYSNMVGEFTRSLSSGVIVK